MSAYDESVSLDELLRIKWMFEQQQKIGHFGTWEWDIRSDKLKWSDQSYRIYGFALGSSLNCETVAGLTHPDDREAAEQAAKKAIEQKSQFEVKYRIIRKNGEVRYIHVYGKVCIDDDGKSQELFGTMQDITENELLRSLAFKADILSAVNEAILATDADGILSFINKTAEDAYQIKASEFIGRHFNELLKKVKILFDVNEVGEKLIATGRCVYEVCFEADEGTKWHEVHSRTIRDDDGIYLGTVCAVRDVTPRKASEATINCQNMILKQINSIYKFAMSCETAQSLGKMCLNIIETVTGSEAGFIAEIDKGGIVHILAGDTLCWDNIKNENMFTKMADDSLIINDMHPYKLPKGHPRINTFLSVSYLRGGRKAGVLGVANRKGGYTGEHKSILDALIPTIIEVLISKRAVERLRDNELLMRTIMDSASDFMFLKDKNSRIVTVNQAYGRVFNVNVNDVIGKNDSELYPDCAIQVVEHDRLVMETGKTLICHESAMTAHGYKTYSLSKVPWKDINGDTIGVLGIAHDITELNETKNSLQTMVTNLKHSKKYIELLYEITEKILSSTTPQEDIDALCDKVMRFIDCDSFFNYLYHEGEEYMQLNACRGISPDARKEVELLPVGAAVCGFALQQRRRIVAEGIQQSDNQRTNLLKSIGIRAYACHPLLADDEIQGTLAFGTTKRDFFKQEELMLMKAVAESIAVSVRRKRTEEKLSEQAKELEIKNKLITDFFINISHEFKTPLSILKLATDLLDHSMHNGSQEKMSGYLNMIRSNSNRLVRLVGNLLDITKVDAGFMSPKRALYDIVGLLNNIVQSIQLYATKRDLSVTFASKTSSKLIYTDSGIVEKIVLNLLSNAIKHTPKGGKICVKFQDFGERILIVVRDNGEGIPDDKINIVFDRFRQVDTSLTRSGEGCGIGLALSKSLAELLDGRIWLKSKHGEGSSFYVELPACDAVAGNAVVTEPEGLENNILIEFSDISFN